jgi:hypothetical protein
MRDATATAESNLAGTGATNRLCGYLNADACGPNVKTRSPTFARVTFVPLARTIPTLA